MVEPCGEFRMFSDIAFGSLVSGSMSPQTCYRNIVLPIHLVYRGMYANNPHHHHHDK